MKLKRLNHITINAPKGSHEIARKFYRDILQLKEIPFPDELEGIYDIMWFQFMDTVLHIEFSDTYKEDQKRFDMSKHIAVEVEKIHEVRREFEENGIKIISGVDLPDRERFYIQDPFGNGFEIIEMNPAHASKS